MCECEHDDSGEAVEQDKCEQDNIRNDACRPVVRKCERKACCEPKNQPDGCILQSMTGCQPEEGSKQEDLQDLDTVNIGVPDQGYKKIGDDGSHDEDCNGF